MAKSKHSSTSFERKWGIRADVLAQAEGVSPATIHMRVYNYGTPFQRKAKPDRFEERFGRTRCEMGDLLDLHPTNLSQRLSYVTNWEDFKRKNKRRTSIKCRTYTNSECTRSVFWLHPSHPDYETERARFEQFREIFDVKD